MDEEGLFEIGSPFNSKHWSWYGSQVEAASSSGISADGLGGGRPSDLLGMCAEL